MSIGRWIDKKVRYIYTRDYSVTQSCPTLCDPMDCSIPHFPVHHKLPELVKLTSVESVMPSNNLMLCCPRLLLCSIFPSIRVFSNESVLCIRWPKYWSFSFSISPSSEYSLLKFIIHIFVSEADICCWRNDSNSTFFLQSNNQVFYGPKRVLLGRRNCQILQNKSTSKNVFLKL